MLKYLVILLDDTSVSYCHADNPLHKKHLMDLDSLKEGLFFAMKENLAVQFVYPDYELPAEYHVVIESVENSKIKPAALAEGADVVVIEGISMLSALEVDYDIPYVLRCTKAEFFTNAELIAVSMAKGVRMNIVIKDIDTLQEYEQEEYKTALAKITKVIENAILERKNPQTNILTDLLVIDRMNNCNAGDESITLAPNGKFYPCPAFYFDEQVGCGADFFGRDFSIGNLVTGLSIKNPQLYKLDYAPICRICDAYHCKRCVWLNRKKTLEVNTPSHEQCVAAHIERNVSRELQQKLKTKQILMICREIPEIDYLDPFEKIQK